MNQDFFQTWGCGVTDNNIYQGNKIAIVVDKNGRSLRSKFIEHLNITYFLSQIGFAKAKFQLKIFPWMT